MMMPSPHSIARILVLFCWFARSSSSSSSSSSYTSVTALNQYGESEQLLNAREAAFRHGTLVGAAKSRDNTVVVVSVHAEKKPGVLTAPQMVQSISPSIFITCSGIKADARWLVQRLRAYQINQWDVYDRYVSATKLYRAISQLLLLFMGYNRSRELTDMQIVDSSKESWGRPLGVMSLLLTCSSISLIEPSGVIQERTAFAIGKESEAVNDELEKKYDANMTTEEVETMLVKLLTEIGNGPNVLIETVSSNGVEREMRRIEV